MKKNCIHHIDFLNNSLPDNCANLIIADPPYFKVKGDFDFIWSSFDEYLKDVDKWARECKRILAKNGTLIWYGPSKKIAYSQIILDLYFHLLNNAVWRKGSFMNLEKTECTRSLANCTERLLIYSNKIGDAQNSIEKIRKYVRDEILLSKGKIILKDVILL